EKAPPAADRGAAPAVAALVPSPVRYAMPTTAYGPAITASPNPTPIRQNHSSRAARGVNGVRNATRTQPPNRPCSGTAMRLAAVPSARISTPVIEPLSDGRSSDGFLVSSPSLGSARIPPRDALGEPSYRSSRTPVRLATAHASRRARSTAPTASAMAAYSTMTESDAQPDSVPGTGFVSAIELTSIIIGTKRLT